MLCSDSETPEQWLQGTTCVWKLTLLSTVTQSQDSGGLGGVYAIPQESGEHEEFGHSVPIQFEEVGAGNVRTEVWGI